MPMNEVDASSQEHNGLSAGNVATGGTIDRSPAGLQYQNFLTNIKASGAAFGKGRNTTPDPDTLFSNPPHPLNPQQFS